MTLATERYRASVEADELWERYVRPLVAVYHPAGMDGFSRGSWRASLGVRVQGAVVDPTEFMALVISLDRAVHVIMRRCQRLRDGNGINKTYVIADKDIHEPTRPWSNERGTGVCDALGLTVVEGMRMLEEAKECVWRQMEQGCDGCHLPPGG